jgi:uncharacterized protein
LALIHKFIQDGEYYVIDVNSGSLHVVDEMVYDLLDSNSLREKKELIESFKNKYTVEDIEEVYSEIQSLIQGDMLYTEDLYESIARSGGESEPYIKALCLNIIHDCNLRCTMELEKQCPQKLE